MESGKVNSIVNNIKNALESMQNNQKLVKSRLNKCSKALRSVGAKQGIMTAIGLGKSYRIQLKLLHRTCTRSKNRANWTSIRVKWVDVKSAFSRRFVRLFP